MPISDRDYVRGKHPASCTCVDCTNRRLGITSNSSSRSDNYTTNSSDASSSSKGYYYKKAPQKNGGLNHGITALVILAVIGGIFFFSQFFGSNTPAPLTTAAPTPQPMVATIQTPTPEYSSFRNEACGYTIDYPYTWTVVNANGTHTLFADKYNQDIEIDLTQENVAFQTEVLSFTHPGSGVGSKIQNSTVGSITYTMLSRKEGTKVKYTYLCNFNPLVLVIECIFHNPDVANREFSRINANVLHMIPTYNNPYIATANKWPEPNPQLIASATPIITSAAIIPTPTKGDTRIDLVTGSYNNFYLGLACFGYSYSYCTGCYDDFEDLIILINNQNAVNPSYNQLISFLEKNKIDTYPYRYVSTNVSFIFGPVERRVNLNRIRDIIDGKIQPDHPNMCGDFAERLHNEAEKAGIRCAFVSIDLAGYTDPFNYGIPSNASHALNAFQTTDKGLIFIDVTNSPGPTRCVKTVNLQTGQEYVPRSLFPESGFSDTWDSIGTVVGTNITWDGTWND